jgi:pyridoxamine 5'-phosphate oxidase
VSAADPLLVEALERLRALLERVKTTTNLPEPSAVCLATADDEGKPRARMVLMRGLDARGLVFYTNLESRKGRHLAANPNAALCFYWPPLAQQVTVEGTIEAVTDAEADAYWMTRPRESQIGAWASLQSQRLPSRFTLLRRVLTETARFGTKPVPRPPHWSGFRLLPTRIEFWSNRPARLHDRQCYEAGEAGWQKFLLYP